MRFGAVPIALALAFALCRPAPAAAQQRQGNGEVAAAEQRLNDELRRLRLDHRRQGRREGLTLLSWGIASALVGASVAAAQRSEEAWLAAGVTTASFGVVDALFALGLLDLSGSRRRSALQGRLGDHEGFEEVRDAAVAAQLGSGQSFAVNAGLDVFYMGTGVLMYVLGRRTDPETAWLRGAGLSTMVQGAFLFAFDLAGWIRSNGRAEALQQLGR